MATNAQTHPAFPFLKLPPELRNRVYNYVFEDDAAQELELLAATTRAAYPCWKITATSRQVQAESSTLFFQAAAAFWTNHSFYIKKLQLPSDTDVRPVYRRLLEQLPNAAKLRSIEGRGNMGVENGSLRFKATISPGANGNLYPLFTLGPFTGATGYMLARTERRIVQAMTEKIAQTGLDLESARQERAFRKRDLWEVMILVLNKLDQVNE